MKFNPIKRILYTDKGEVIRKLDCPYKVAFTEEVSEVIEDEHICSICNGEIVDINRFDEDSLIQMCKTTNLCLKVDSSQPNLRIIYIQ